MPIISRLPIGVYNDEEHNVALVKRQAKDVKTKVLPEIVSILTGSMFNIRKGDCGPMVL